jgi:hypothetical protein
MSLKCTGCGAISEDEINPRFCREMPNGKPCGSLMLTFEKEIPEPARPRKDGK